MADEDDRDDDIDELEEEEEDDDLPDPIMHAFAKAMDVACVKSFGLDFASAVQEYQAVQAEFLAQVGDRENDALEIRRRVAEMILDTARGKTAPFETCMDAWNELLQLGFTDVETKCTMTWFYAECCRKHRQVDIGLGVLDPLIAELERLRADPAVTKHAAKYYRNELDNLQKLRAELEALRT